MQQVESYTHINNSGSLHIIVLPKDLILWILNNINTPIAGFDHKKNTDGSLYSFAQQINETRYQVMLVASYFFRKGETTTKIQAKIECFK